jgi:hypothetical protein
VFPHPPRAATAQNTSAAVLPPSWVTADGNRMLSNAGLGGGGGAANNLRGFGYPQVLERTGGGWTSRPAIDGPPPSVVLNSTAAPPMLQIPSVDRTTLLFTSGVNFSPDQPAATVHDGSGAAHATNADGSVRWLSRPSWAGADLPPGTSGVRFNKFAVVGGSRDLSTVYFMTRQTLTPEDGASGRTWDQRWALYKVKNGVLSNAGTLPDGTVDAAGSMSAGLDLAGDVGALDQRNFRETLGNGHVVSDDGARALFVDTGDRTVPGRVGQLYMHRDGQPSLLLSKEPAASSPIVGSTGVVPVGVLTSQPGTGVNVVGAAHLAMADRDLTTVLFSTRDALTSGAPSSGTRVNTYRYLVASNTLERLPDLERPGSAASRTQVGNVYRMSDDGTRILFRSEAGELKLWRAGLPTLTLASGVGVTNTASTGVSAARFSADGKTVIFLSRQPIGGNPNHPPPVSSSLARTQVYRFNEDEGGAPACVSCPPLDAAVRGPATFDLFTRLNNGFGGANESLSVAQMRMMSDDGSRIFFTTTSTLDARDQNSAADVYEWSAARGSAALISSGAPGSGGDALIDVDATGDNVFFATEVPLTASDTDDVADFYVARVGGGFPDPPGFDREPGCVLLECQPRPSGPGPLPDPRSIAGGAAPEGATDLGSAGGPRSFAVRRTRASAARATLGVSVPGRGTIRVSGKGVRTTSRRATRAATYTVHARLTAMHKRRVARFGRVTLRLRVRFTPAGGKPETTTARVVVQRSPKGNRKGVR